MATYHLGTLLFYYILFIDNLTDNLLKTFEGNQKTVCEALKSQKTMIQHRKYTVSDISFEIIQAKHVTYSARN